LHILRAGHAGLVGLPDIGMVDVVFYEEYVFHLAIQQRLVVGESQDMFGNHIF
jgi:hypothetical protein